MSRNNNRSNDFEINKKGMTVYVRDNNVDQALRQLKRRMTQEGVTKDMRKNERYEKPSEKRVRAKAQARKRHLKKMRQKALND